jgi:hypothetical protein
MCMCRFIYYYSGTGLVQSKVAYFSFFLSYLIKETVFELKIIIILEHYILSIFFMNFE